MTSNPPGARARAFIALGRDVATCTACDGMARTHTLGPGNGPLDARVLFVAEAPGRRGAAITGMPLCGDEAGRRFERFLSLAGLRREEVFVTNAVLCNPLDRRGCNRRPSAGEIARCRPFLERTLELCAAPTVVALGRVALDALATIEPHGLVLGSDVGRIACWRERVLVALYHPGRQSTLHRPDAEQCEDWQRLGELARTRATIG